MNFDMIYDGQVLDWKAKGKFKATSGLPGYQMPKNQCIRDNGIIPEGFYKLFLSDHGTAKDDGRGLCAIKPSWGVQKIPRGVDAGDCESYWANWGKNRARMEPADLVTKLKCSPDMRGGFYLHDSSKGFSHGCIEVETKIFPLLRSYNKTTKKSSVIIKVEYVKGRSTYGDTKI